MIVGPSPGGIVIGVELGTITGGVTEVCGAVTGVVAGGVVAGAVVIGAIEGSVTTFTDAPLTRRPVVDEAGVDVVVARNLRLVVDRTGTRWAGNGASEGVE